MSELEHYQAVLRRQAPSSVSNVELNVPGQQVMGTVEGGPEPSSCPECREHVPGYDRKRRRWPHLDTCHFTT